MLRAPWILMKKRGLRIRSHCPYRSPGTATDPQILRTKRKNKPQIVTAVGREWLGFIWAIAVQTEAKFKAERKAA